MQAADWHADGTEFADGGADALGVLLKSEQAQGSTRRRFEQARGLTRIPLSDLIALKGSASGRASGGRPIGSTLGFEIH
ncbi:hypothetical protein AB2M62_07380 [Sphingomonas sp. MMS12-HWE2-04]|uniref:hypothetical protein n=1 Tax=Sphingomonas sp. MMS12-HWE2-04 TaxID=3234199 RepID=UPI00384AAC9D